MTKYKNTVLIDDAQVTKESNDLRGETIFRYFDISLSILESLSLEAKSVEQSLCHGNFADTDKNMGDEIEVRIKFNRGQYRVFKSEI